MSTNDSVGRTIKKGQWHIQVQTTNKEKIIVKFKDG
jgi:hypothetical protein